MCTPSRASTTRDKFKMLSLGYRTNTTGGGEGGEGGGKRKGGGGGEGKGGGGLSQPAPRYLTRQITWLLFRAKSTKWHQPPPALPPHIRLVPCTEQAWHSSASCWPSPRHRRDPCSPTLAANWEAPGEPSTQPPPCRTRQSCPTHPPPQHPALAHARFLWSHLQAT